MQTKIKQFIFILINVLVCTGISEAQLISGKTKDTTQSSGDVSNLGDDNEVSVGGIKAKGKGKGGFFTFTRGQTSEITDETTATTIELSFLCCRC